MYVPRMFSHCTAHQPQGGMKAVVWVDTVQLAVMFGGILIIIVKGSMDGNGPAIVWERASLSGRLDFVE